MARILPGDRRYLVTQRLATAGWHQHQRVAAIYNVLNDGFLRAAKRRITEDLAKYFQWRRVG